MSVEQRAKPAAGENEGSLDARGRWSVGRMMRDPVLDSMALAGRPISALILGCGDGWPVWALAELGVGRVLGVDARPAELERAREVRELLAYEKSKLRLERAQPLEIASSSFELVLLAETAGYPAAESDALELAHGCNPIACLIFTTDGLASREHALAAGFDSVSLLDPPADSPRSLILGERCLLSARARGRSNDGG
ncbi:MAG: methyltransferase domain-containing protein [Solirubrobacterales bacterium]